MSPTNQEIIDKIVAYHSENGKISKKSFQMSSLASKRFGSWNNALISSGIPINRRQKKERNKCLICGKETDNKKFCSRSCSAVNSNRVSPRVKRLVFKCLICNKDALYKRMYCQDHNPIKERWREKTIQDVLSGSKAQLYSVVRQTARKTYRESGRPQECLVCKYNLHVEICHINAVSGFPKSTKLSEVNHIDNLIPLCPTHHWEFDNGYINITPEEGRTPIIHYARSV